MGEVWLAEQRQPVRRQVALKVIKAGMDTREVIARFEAERQALALMNHPNIAGVFDAGATPEGRPYFAMEYVQGIPITEYCDKQRLSIRERLTLFVDVCAGVQHAHQKGIIHRDIKPSNVLVTTQDEKHTPKIIDFGVAKATSQRLTERTVFTELGSAHRHAGVHEPRAGGDDEPRHRHPHGRLLARRAALRAARGRAALRLQGAARAGLAEIQRTLREDEPPRPSSRISSLGAASTVSAANRRVDSRGLARALEGDLDWITMKALEKDRVRRYDTAHALALDIERHLHDEPVLAGPPSGLYRVRKLSSRHRGTVPGGGGRRPRSRGRGHRHVVGAAAGDARRAAGRRQRRRGRRQTAIAEAVNAFLNEDLLAVARPSAARGQGKDVDDAGGARRGGRAHRGSLEGRRTIRRRAAGRGADPKHARATPISNSASMPRPSRRCKRALELRRGALGNEHEATVRMMSMLGLHPLAPGSPRRRRAALSGRGRESAGAPGPGPSRRP